MISLQISLSAKDKALIYQAMASGATIIIDGDRTGPTGKSTLCDWINNHGGNAVEVWELEDGRKKLDRGKNTAYVYVQLDEKFKFI